MDELTKNEYLDLVNRSNADGLKLKTGVYRLGPRHIPIFIDGDLLKIGKQHATDELAEEELETLKIKKDETKDNDKALQDFLNISNPLN